MNEVCAVIERETGQTVTADTLLSDLDVDSLEFMDLLLKIEEATGVLVPYENVADMDTVGNLIVAVEHKCR